MKQVKIYRREPLSYMSDDSRTILTARKAGGFEWDTVMASDVLRSALVADLRTAVVWDDDNSPDTERP